MFGDLHLRKKNEESIQPTMYVRMFMLHKPHLKELYIMYKKPGVYSDDYKFTRQLAHSMFFVYSSPFLGLNLARYRCGHQVGSHTDTDGKQQF